MRKKAIITGITGQDGSYLAEFLLHKGYEVHGIIRRTSTFNTQRIDHIFQDPHEEDVRLFLHYGDVNDHSSLHQLLKEIQPDEFYNLAAQSHVKVSFSLPTYTSMVVGISVVEMLEAIRVQCDNCKFYQASSSEMFGNSPPPQKESSYFAPRSPYAAAKLYAYWIAKIYRESYNLFVSNGILFNHESPRRGETFVTRKITRAISSILLKEQNILYLGNLDAKRDWGYAPEYVIAMWKMLQVDQPDDFVIGTGETHSVREFVEIAFDYVGLNWEQHVKIDDRYFRPTEVEMLIADSSKAFKILNWKPRIKFRDLVKIMVDYDMKRAGLKPIGEGINLTEKLGLSWTKHSYTIR